MFSGRYKPVTDPQGRFFIDRDGTLFKHVLNFLRMDSIVSVDVSDVPLLSELLQEAMYYQIEPLVQILKTSLNMAEPEDVALAQYRSRGPATNTTTMMMTGNKGGTSSAPAAAATPHDLHPSSSAPHLPYASSSSTIATRERPHPGGATNMIANRAQSSRQLLRTMSTLFSRHIALGPLDGYPVYSREEIHLLKLKHASGMSARTTRLNLAGLDLRCIDLSKLDLYGVDFSRCNLEGASFESANLINCSFAEANVRRTNFQQASFGNSDLECPDFTDAELQGANFTRYRGLLFRSRFEGVEDEMIGLELRWLR